jgi:monofunctional chorismate mutase
MKNKLIEYRKEIDRVDKSILDLLIKRLNIVKKIGKYKAKTNIKIQNKKREAQILKRVADKSGKNKINKEYTKSIFKSILENSRGIQKNNMR